MYYFVIGLVFWSGLAYSVPTLKTTDLVPDVRGDVQIPAGVVVELNSDIEARHLDIRGHLRCPDRPGSFKVVAATVSITGSMICGERGTPFPGRLQVLLKSGFELSDMGERAVIVFPGGELHLHGMQLSHSWLRLGSHFPQGSKVVTVSEKTDWSVGDEILVTSSSFDMNEAETFLIEAVAHTNMKTDRPAKFAHFGERMNLHGSVIDERSVAANLSRNIQIRPYGNEHRNDELGAHVMVMRGGKAFVDSVSFQFMGRKGELGRYPFHWHLTGNVKGQYIRNSVIRDSYQRCVVVHKTHHAKVENNICYNHFGHGFFLEHGNERKNLLKANLAAVAKVISEDKAILRSDFDGKARRFPPPASYWISNPDNKIIDNLAAGSEGTGFWMAFADFQVCDSRLPCAIPKSENTDRFDGNIAHSSKVGITWDGAPSVPVDIDGLAPLKPAHYSPRRKAVFRNLLAYKNSEAGIYYRGDAATFENTVLADNTWHAFFAFSQLLKDSVIVGYSPNNSDEDRRRLAEFARTQSLIGVAVYDGPFELENVAFLAFPEEAMYVNGQLITPIPISSIGAYDRFENKVKGLVFNPEPWKRVFLDNEQLQNWKDSSYSTSIRDLDGTLTGTPGSVVVPKYDINQTDDCMERDDWNAYVCQNYATGTYRIQRGGSVGIDVHYNIRRETTEFFYDQLPLDYFHNKFNTITGLGEVYIVDPHRPTFYGPGGRFSVFYYSEAPYTPGEIVRFLGATHCSVSLGGTPLTPVDSLSILRTEPVTAYFQSSDSLFLKMLAQRVHPNNERSRFSKSFFSQAVVSCNEHPMP